MFGVKKSASVLTVFQKVSLHGVFIGHRFGLFACLCNLHRWLAWLAQAGQRKLNPMARSVLEPYFTSHAWTSPGFTEWKD